jgi:hypothetical protein
MSKTVAVGDRCRTDWALGAKDGASHYGVAVASSPTGAYLKVSWNDDYGRAWVARSELSYVDDAYHSK